MRRPALAASAALASALALAACATDGHPVRTTEARVAGATAACHAPRDAVILNKDRTYSFNPADSDARINCLEWELLDCGKGMKMFEPMGCIKTRN